MFKNFDLIILTILLAIIAFILSVKLINMNIVQSSLIVFFSLLSIPLYKGCKKSQKKGRKNTFWKNYWYDMQCKISMIFYGIVAAIFIAWVIK